MLRRSFLALATLALAVGLTACGGVKDTVDPVAQAATKSADAGGVKMHLDATFSVAGQSASFSADGAFDGDQGEMTMDMGELLSRAGVGGDGTFKLVMLEEGGDHVVYMNMAGLLSSFGLGGGKTWMKMNLEQTMANAGLGDAAKNLLGASNQNPAQALEMLKKVADVTKVGEETVDGTRTTHYRATIDVKDALEKAGLPASSVQEITSSGMSAQVPVEVWVGDDDGLVRRMTIDYGSAAAGQAFSGQLTMTLRDWGSDVSVEAPPADQVFDLGTVLKDSFGAPQTTPSTS
jgi:hypothetical protein